MLHGDPIGAAKRRSVAKRRIGAGKKCACGESRPQALIVGSDPPICIECKRLAHGHTIYDKHHPARKANDDRTVLVLANDHQAELTEAQHEWPKTTRENRNRDPLLADAARICGHVDTVGLIDGISTDLEKLSAALVALLGRQWFLREEFAECFERAR
jgi:hypothetical protein